MILILDVDKAKFLDIARGSNYNIDSASGFYKKKFNFSLSLLLGKVEITKTILVNFNNSSIVQGDIIEYLSTPYFQLAENTEFNKCAQKEYQLLKNSKPFNVQDIKISGNDDVCELIKKYAANDKIAFYSEWISASLINILKNIENVEGYRIKHFDANNKLIRECVKIENLERYYQLYQSIENDLNKSIGSYESIPSLFVEAFVSTTEEKDSSFTQSVLYNNFNEFTNSDTKRIILIGGDNYLSNRFIAEAENQLGKFYWIDLSCDILEQKKWNTNLVFTSIGEASKAKLSDLVKALSQRKHIKKKILLQSESVIDSLLETDFRSVYIPTTNHCKAIFNIFFYLIAKEKNFFWTNKNKYIYQMDYRNLFKLKSINAILEKIPSLKELDNILEDIKNIPNTNPSVSDINFWIDLDDYIQQKYNQEEKQKIIYEEKRNTLLEEDSKPKYIFTKEPNGDYHIVFNGHEVFVKNRKADGLFYIQQIIKYGALDPVPAEDLYDRKIGNIKSIVSSKTRNNLDELEQNDEDSSTSVSESFIAEKITRAKKDELGFDLTDKKTINAIKETIEKIKEEVADNKKNGIYDNDDLENDLATYKEYLKSTEGKSGSIKKTKTSKRLSKKAIDKAIKLIEDETKSTYPEFSRFIKDDILYHYAAFCYSYRKRDHIHWQLV